MWYEWGELGRGREGGREGGGVEGRFPHLGLASCKS